jgi:serine/threonine-protein kinase
VVQFDGTPMYISPEQVNGERVDARTDLYSLGAVLFELLTCEPPFGGSSTVAVLAARLLRPPPDPRERRGAASAAAGCRGPERCR